MAITVLKKKFQKLPKLPVQRATIRVAQTQNSPLIHRQQIKFISNTPLRWLTSNKSCVLNRDSAVTSGK